MEPCHDEIIVKCTCVTFGVTHFVNSSYRMRDRWYDMARHGANYSTCRLDRLRVTKMARLGTPYCGELREQNSCQCEACFTLHAVGKNVLPLDELFTVLKIVISRAILSEIFIQIF